MLGSMRKNLKSLSWTLWLVILAFIGFIFVQWGSGRFDGEGLDLDVAAVGRSAISGEEFQKNLARTLEMYKQQFKDGLSRQAIQQLGVPEQVLQGMISGRVVRAEAERLGLSVSDAELGEAIRRNPSFQRDGKFIGSAEYERLLAYNHVTVVEFEESLRQDLLADKLKELVTAGLVLDSGSLREDFQREKDKAELEVIALRLDAAPEAPVADEAGLRAFYEKNPALFRGEEKRSGQVLALKFADLKKELGLKEEELFAYYQQNKSLFRIPGKTKVSRIFVPYEEAAREETLKRMEETAAGLVADGFAAKAREMSADEKAGEGGDWGYWGWQGFSAQEKTMIERLKQGEISPPVDTGKGFALLLAGEKVEEQQENFDVAKPRIRGVLENERLRKLSGERMAQAYARIKKAGNLEAGAARLGAKVVASEPLARGQALPGIDDMGAISQKLFALGEGEISEPLELADGVAVVRLTAVKRPQIEPFEEAREKVAREAGKAARLERLQERARRVAGELARLGDGKKIEAFLKQEGLKSESASFRRGGAILDLEAPAGLDETVFALAENAYAPLALKNGAAVVKLTSRQVVNDEEFAKERQSYYAKRLAEARNSRFSAFLMGRKDEYKVRFNAERFEKVKESVISRFR